MTWIMYILYYYAYIFYTYVDYLYITYFFFVIISLLTLMFHFSYWWASSVLKHKRDLHCSSKEMKISCNDIYVKVKMPFNYLCLHFINFHFLWMSEINSQYSLDVHILLFFSFVDLLSFFKNFNLPYYDYKLRRWNAVRAWNHCNEVLKWGQSFTPKFMASSFV